MKKIVVIVGPTGVGKTDLSIKLAKHYNTSLISGDSIQVYRSLNIGSGKIKENEKQGIKHYLIDILDPLDDFSVRDFQVKSREIIDSMDTLPILVGGTGYYLRACLFNYEFTIEKRTDKYSNLTNEEIYNKLVELKDSNIPNVNNRIRLLRHLEILEDHEEPHKKDEPVYDYLIIGLTCDRDKLYERINNRVDKMIEEGLVDEVKALYDSNIRSKAVSSIGYKELYDYFDGLDTYENTIALIKQHSRNFAKRQMTWFKNQMDTKWIDILNEDPYKKSVELIDNFLKETN